MPDDGVDARVQHGDAEGHLQADRSQSRFRVVSRRRDCLDQEDVMRADQRSILRAQESELVDGREDREIFSVLHQRDD